MRRILFVSHTYVGRGHDFSILKAEFPPEKNWFEGKEVYIDLGYVGFEKEYKCSNVHIPHKKKKNQELTEDQKVENKAVSSTRIVVEHSIGGLKRYGIVSNRLRMHDYHEHNIILGVCAGLWNYNILT